MKTVTILTAMVAVASLGTATLLAMPPGPQGQAYPDAPGEEYGKPQRPGHPPPPPMPAPEQLAQIGVPTDQIEVLMQFQYEQNLKRIDLRAAVEKAESTLDSFLRATATHEKVILEAVDVLNQARGALFKLDIADMLKVNQMLGEDVLRKLREQMPRDRTKKGGCGRGQEDFDQASSVVSQGQGPERGE